MLIFTCLLIALEMGSELAARAEEGAGPRAPQLVELDRVLTVSPVKAEHPSLRVVVDARVKKGVRRAQFFLQGVRYDINGGRVSAGHSFAKDGTYSLAVSMTGEFEGRQGTLSASGTIRVSVRQSEQERKREAGLIRRLDSASPEDRRVAAKELVALSPVRAEARLARAAVEDEDSIVRMHCLTALWVMPSVDGLSAAVAALGDSKNVGLAEAMLRNLTGEAHVLRGPLSPACIAAQRKLWQRVLDKRGDELRRRLGR